MFGEKLNGTDPEDVIRNAFACFDENNSGNGKEFNIFFFYELNVTVICYNSSVRCCHFKGGYTGLTYTAEKRRKFAYKIGFRIKMQPCGNVGMWV